MFRMDYLARCCPEQRHQWCWTPYSLGKDPNASKVNGGWTPLFVSAHYTHPDIAEVLLGAGAEGNRTDGNGSSALDVVATIGAIVLVKLFLQRDADVEGGPREFHDTPLINAAAKGT